MCDSSDGPVLLIEYASRFANGRCGAIFHTYFDIQRSLLRSVLHGSWSEEDVVIACTMSLISVRGCASLQLTPLKILWKLLCT